MRKTLLLMFLSAFTTSFLCNAQTDTVNFGTFENGSLSPWYSWGAPISIEPNPSKTGNASDSVALLDQTGKTWNGFAMWNPGLVAPIDDSITLDVYLNVAGVIQIYVGDPASSGTANYTKSVSVTAKTWTHVSFDLSNLPAYDYQQIAFQSDISDSVFLDNIMLYRDFTGFVNTMITRETFGTINYDTDDTVPKSSGWNSGSGAYHYNWDEVMDFSSTNGHFESGSDSSIRIMSYGTSWPLRTSWDNPSAGAALLLTNRSAYSGSWDTAVFKGININNTVITSIDFGYSKNTGWLYINPDTNALNVEYRVDGGPWVQLDTSLIDTISAGVWEAVHLPVNNVEGSTMDIRFVGLITEQVFLDDISVYGMAAPPAGSNDFTISHVIVGTVTDSTDWYGGLHMSWDMDSLYLQFDITDDTVISAGGPNYDVDNIEIYLDMTNSKRIHWPRNGGWMAGDTTYDSLDYQLRLVPDSAFAVNNATRDGGGISVADSVVKQVYTRTSGGYQFMLNIAWKGLMPSFNPAAGTQIGFDVLASDADKVNAVTDANRNQITFNSPTDKPFNDPSLFSTLELETGGGFKVIPDDQAPSAPANVKATVDTSAVKVTWDASTDNVAVMKYMIISGADTLATMYAKQTGNSYTATGLANGSYVYAIEAIDNYGNISKASSAQFTILVSGINNTITNNVKLYPNPVSDVLNISNAASVVSVDILGINGTVISSVANHSVNDLTINTQSLTSGIYFVKMRTKDGSIIMNKFIKK